MGARRRCCCDCYFVFDPFPVDGEDVNDVNPYWQECNGDWEITNGMLTTEDANAVCSFVPMVGWPVGIMTARVTISKIEPPINSFGGTAQMFAFIGAPGGPCGGMGLGTYAPWKAELEIVDGNDGELRLYNPAGELAGARSVVFSVGWTEFWMCVGWDADLEWGEVLCGCDDAPGPPIWACHEGMPDYYFALGNKSAAPNQVYYEEVFYIDQYDHNPLCPDCSIPCCCPCIEQELNRPTLRATVVKGLDPDCEIAGGEDAILSCSVIEGECCVWTSTDLVLVCKEEDEIELALSMRCGGESGYGVTGRCQDYYMTVSLKNPTDPDEGCCVTIAGTASQDPVTKGIVFEDGAWQCDCFPALYLKFGPFYIWRNPSMLNPECCKCCQEFYIEVVEA